MKTLDSATVSAVLFAKDLDSVAAFYVEALEMTRVVSDEHHWALHGHGFDLIIHQIPRHIADGMTIEKPPQRRVWGAIRLNFPIADVVNSRRVARSLGGQLDDSPPEWADAGANFFLGHDPEGNVFGVRQQGNEHAS